MHLEVHGLEGFLSLSITNSKNPTLSAIMRRIDSTGKGQIGFEDFIKFLTPTSEGEKRAEMSQIITEDSKEEYYENRYRRNSSSLKSIRGHKFSQIEREVDRKRNISKLKDGNGGIEGNGGVDGIGEVEVIGDMKYSKMKHQKVGLFWFYKKI